MINREPTQREKRAYARLVNVASSYGASPTEHAALALVQQIDSGDTHILGLVGDILASSSSIAPEDRARALCRLLAVHGVGSIVESRIA
jgi:hypothetical protein